MKGEKNQWGHQPDLCPTCGNHQRTRFQEDKDTILFCPHCGYHEPLNTHIKTYRK